MRLAGTFVLIVAASTAIAGPSSPSPVGQVGSFGGIVGHDGAAALSPGDAGALQGDSLRTSFAFPLALPPQSPATFGGQLSVPTTAASGDASVGGGALGTIVVRRDQPKFDQIDVIPDTVTVPAPAAALLGVLGLAIAGARARRA